MKVILNQDVKKLGKRGDIVEVAEGYGRNYLLPRGLALEASKGNLSHLAHENALVEVKKEKELKKAQETGRKLEGSVLEIKAKAGEEGRLFGSVTNKELAQEIKKKYGVSIDKRKIELPENIKNVGTYTAGIKIHPQVHVKIKISVSAQE